MEALWASGAIVQAYDPVAMEEAERIYGKHAGLTLCGDKYAALQGADAVVICTEWQQFCVPDFSEMAIRMCNKVIVDGRNLYQPKKLLAPKKFLAPSDSRQMAFGLSHLTAV